jgi:hypothetical protein
MVNIAIHIIPIGLIADMFQTDRFCSDRFHTDRFHTDMFCLGTLLDRADWQNTDLVLYDSPDQENMLRAWSENWKHASKKSRNLLWVKYWSQQDGPWTYIFVNPSVIGKLKTENPSLHVMSRWRCHLISASFSFSFSHFSESPCTCLLLMWYHYYIEHHLQDWSKFYWVFL